MRNWGPARVAIAAACLLAGPATASEGEGSLHDLITVLKDRGVIDESDYEDIASKNAAYEAQQEEDRKPALSFWGDFRFRYESFLYDEDETGVEQTNRHRARYRFRLNGKAEINDHATMLVRFASGSDDLRSTNQTLGRGADFDTDDFRIDRAYARVSPFAHGSVGEDGTLFVELGKVPNPFVWKKGKDFMIWDNDISLEGGSVLTTWRLSEGFEAFMNGGYYVLDENTTGKDPHLWAAQLGFHAEAARSIAFGGRASYFHFDSLDPSFHVRSFDGTGSSSDGGGSILDGLSGGLGNQDVQVVEATAYLALLTDGDWPVLVYGTWVNNLTAEASVQTLAGEEDTAWGVGVEVGDKKRYVKLGAGYWMIEANAFPSQFLDSDLFDGTSNRKGWAAYLSRSIWKNTDVNLTAFISDEIKDDVPPFGESAPDADRVRIQADLVLSFR